MKNDKIIVVFGGSFNPPLNSHFSLAEQIVSEYENVEKIIFVPVNQKYQKKGLLENKYRYEILIKSTSNSELNKTLIYAQQTFNKHKKGAMRLKIDKDPYFMM